ncbi:hypothetical protein DL766_009062 [Monosporascus sp. MC13-8B]|nr:hypothetical protein DL763_005614 [Monosporascus cannonballus]RYP16686.1 hypothetical protein DL766_009062 [Monosporascus sp. MC13-8B]
MASPHLDIAKVSFSAVLLRPDPTPCSRSDLDEFIRLVDATVSRCSPSNVQKSKQWILQHLVHSPGRVAALGKYLTALAKSFSATLAATRQAREPSSKRKRLHVLYLLNDVLYHAAVRDRDSSFPAKVEPFLPDLIQTAAAFSNSPKHAKKVQDLVGLWEENRCFAPGFVEKLRSVAKDAPKLEELKSASNGTADGNGAATSKSSKNAPFIMPAMHGDAAAPWYDLPAANWLPVIEPNSTRPMNPDMIKPLQFVPGPADKRLIQAVTDLLADVERIYAKDRVIGDGPAEDIDQLGQRVIVDEITGDVVSGETYYGWTRAFCEKMKQRRKDPNRSQDDRRGRSVSRSPSRSGSSSRSSSRPAFKRPRLSGSRSRSRSRGRSRRSRSYSRERHRQRYSTSRSRSRPRRGWRDNSSQSPSRSPSRGHSPPLRPPPSQQPPSYGNQQQGYSNDKQPGYHPQAAPLPPALNPQFQPPPGAFPPPIPPPGDFSQFMVPPPPPPNFRGQWPPPPPPVPPGGAMPNWMPGMVGGWGGVPPPPPPLQQQQQNQHQYQGGGGHHQYGRGGGRGDYRGNQGHRGGWNRGRGW